jgi:hypothetical protein
MSAGLGARFVRFAPPPRELDAPRAADFRMVDFDGDFRMVDFDADFRMVAFDGDFRMVDFDADFRMVDFDADFRMVDFDGDFRPAGFAAPVRFAAPFLAPGFLVAMRSPRMKRSWFQSETVGSSRGSVKGWSPSQVPTLRTAPATGAPSARTTPCGSRMP